MRSFGRPPSRTGWYILAAVVLGLIAAYFLWPAGRAFVDEAYGTLTSDDRSRIERWVAGFGGAGPLVIVGAMLVQTFVPVIPSVAIMVVAVLAYGPLLGGLLAWGGLLLSAAVAYLVGRLFGPAVVASLVGRGSREEVESLVRRYGAAGVIAFRIAPALSDDAISLVAGLAGMPFGTFMLASAAGILPLAVLVAVFGQRVEGLGSLFLWASVVSVAVFAAYVVVDHRSSKRQG